MRKVLSFFMVLLMSTAMFAQNDLMDWANEKTEKKVNIVTVEKYTFPLQVQDGKIVSSGSVLLPGKSAQDIFVSSMLWVVSTYPSSRAMFKKIDSENFRFFIEPIVISTQYASTSTYYKCKLVVQAKEGELIFQAFDITCTHLGSGLSLSLKTETFEELMPDLNPKKKKNQIYMEEFVEGNSKTISMMAHNSNLEPSHSIAHWDKITNGIVVVGMTSVECLLAWGKPNKINISKGEYGNLQQWVYKGRQYLYIDDGKLKSMQDF